MVEELDAEEGFDCSPGEKDIWLDWLDRNPKIVGYDARELAECAASKLCEVEAVVPSTFSTGKIVEDGASEGTGGGTVTHEVDILQGIQRRGEATVFEETAPEGGGCGMVFILHPGFEGGVEELGKREEECILGATDSLEIQPWLFGSPRTAHEGISTKMF